MLKKTGEVLPHSGLTIRCADKLQPEIMEGAVRWADRETVECEHHSQPGDCAKCPNLESNSESGCAVSGLNILVKCLDEAATPWYPVRVLFRKIKRRIGE